MIALAVVDPREIVPEDVAARTSFCYAVEGPRGPVGIVGLIPTSLIANEYFVWFSCRGRIGRLEMAQLASSLAGAKQRFNATFCITTAAENERLQKWAKMLGFTRAGDMDGADMWRL